MERRAAGPSLAAAVLAVALGCAAADRPAPAASPTAAAAASAPRPRAVVLFIGDGMGFAQLAVTRDLLYGKGERLALAVLGREDGGFFLMVEGGRIDHAAHGFDPAGTAAETRAFDRAVEEALAFQRARPDTLLLLTADHATGGLAINDAADWAALARQRASVAWLARALRQGAGGDVVAEATGFELTPEEMAAVRAEKDVYEAERALGTALSRRHRVTFMPKVNLDDTKGHTGEDVPLYAGGPGAERFAGVLDNAELPRRLTALLGWEWTPGPR